MKQSGWNRGRERDSDQRASGLGLLTRDHEYYVSRSYP